MTGEHDLGEGSVPKRQFFSRSCTVLVWNSESTLEGFLHVGLHLVIPYNTDHMIDALKRFILYYGGRCDVVGGKSRDNYTNNDNGGAAADMTWPPTKATGKNEMAIRLGRCGVGRAENDG